MLNEWCDKLGRDPKEIERTVAIGGDDVDKLDAFAEAGADHVIIMSGPPFDLDPLGKALASR